jgi:hypothetical protein
MRTRGRAGEVSCSMQQLVHAGGGRLERDSRARPASACATVKSRRTDEDSARRACRTGCARRVGRAGPTLSNYHHVMPRLPAQPVDGHDMAWLAYQAESGYA